MPPPNHSNKPTLAQWIFDTRSWYAEATRTKDLETHAARALSLVPASITKQVLNYFHVRDAKMALGSDLLKRYAISKLTHTPWQRITFTRDSHTKPVYVDPATGRQPVSFNISHQAGIVAIVAVANFPSPTSRTDQDEDAGEETPPAQVGVDVVCTSERRDRDQEMIAKDGWPTFVDMHADVLSPGEVSYLKHRVLAAVPELVAPPPPPPTAEAINDGKLRAFYALWALREAYVKLTGEALLAEWLKELEFPAVRPTNPTPGWGVPAWEEGGEVLRDVEILFKGRKVEDVNMSLRSMGQDYMIATAVRTPGRPEEGLGWTLGPYEMLSLEEVLRFAEASR
ncbi:4'-phosphopantetheinyl transferase [Parathielavia appendiculata]|uniref:holo-[acyl-carrier-protein] synthase n=1 Tax=Parathielavia appendiculata TaxID=2587402 RepID=A0AAN6U2J5_9PEZI|nr:4'-phosphopantetheinyl transferase [Parathielavia appendiculata]